MKLNKSFSRRKLFFQGGKTLLVFATANVGVYTMGSAFKDLDGSMVAGAKCAPPAPRCVDNPRTPGIESLRCCEGPPDYWECAAPLATTC